MKIKPWLTIMNITFSQACENNKNHILSVLQQAFSSTKQVLEIGSGTGQHSVHFATNLPHLAWQTSDLPINHYSINARKEDSQLENLFAPITIDLNQEWLTALEDSDLSTATVDGIFTANTLHIISWHLVQQFFNSIKEHLAIGGILCIYGPFNYQGKFTSESNAQFDLWLKDRDGASGIRDFEQVQLLAKAEGLALLQDHSMPANNRLLVFKRINKI